jgi:transposase
LTADLVAAFVSSNSLPVAELPALIHSVHSTLTRIATGAVEPPAPTPAVPARKSITPDYLIYLDDGKKLVGDRTRIVNQMKSTLARFGIRGFKPTLRTAHEKLNERRTAEGTLLPENTCAELRRDMARLRFLREQIKEIEQLRLHALEAAAPEKKGSLATVRLIARVIGIGIETADMLGNEILSRHLRDRRAVARYAGLTGSPDESGKRRREKGLARAGSGRARRGMIQLAWRFLRFQKDSVLAQWYPRVADGRSGTRKTMIVALARKLLIALWRMAATGEIPEGVILRVA